MPLDDTHFITRYKIIGGMMVFATDETWFHKPLDNRKSKKENLNFFKEYMLKRE